MTKIPFNSLKSASILLLGKILNDSEGAELSALLLKAPTLTGAYNTVYAVRCRSFKSLTSFGTSHTPGTLYAMPYKMA